MIFRSFFALRVPERIAKELANFSDELCEFDRGLDAHWVDSTSYHLTLCFLGDITLEQVEKLEQLVSNVSLGQRFSAGLDRIGYYAVNPELSLVAAMSSGDANLTRLHDTLMTVADQAGVVHRDQNFMPHVTLARLPADNRFAENADLPPLGIQLPADSIVLFESRKGDSGSIYKPLFEIELPRFDT